MRLRPGVTARVLLSAQLLTVPAFPALSECVDKTTAALGFTLSTRRSSDGAQHKVSVRYEGDDVRRFVRRSDNTIEESLRTRNGLLPLQTLSESSTSDRQPHMRHVQVWEYPHGVPDILALSGTAETEYVFRIMGTFALRDSNQDTELPDRLFRARATRAGTESMSVGGCSYDVDVFKFNFTNLQDKSESAITSYYSRDLRVVLRNVSIMGERTIITETQAISLR